MAEYSTTAIAAVEVNYRCDFCGEADVVFTCIVRTYKTPNRHTCPLCKRTVSLAEKFPLLRHGESPTDASADPIVLQGRINLLGEALGNVLIAAKMLRADVGSLSGPELLVAADDFCRAEEFHIPEAERNFQLIALPPVERDDGRFYIPVTKVGEDTPILRVSTDIFEGDMENKVNRAIEFACDLTARWNRGPC